MKTPNVMSVDVEDYFHAEAFVNVVRLDDWENYTSRVENNTKRLLDLFAGRGTQATFFVIGWVADRYPSLIREIAAAGHELACHSYWHRLIYKLDFDEFRQDTRQAKAAIEQAAGEPVFGYRAPTFSITRDSLWAFEILVEEGFTYDSSVFPIHHDRYGIADAPRVTFRINTLAGPLVEHPLTTFQPLKGHNFPFGGGGYLRLAPSWYTKWGFRCIDREGLPVISYVHPWEIDPEQPRLPGGFSCRLRHYTNLSKTFSRVETMLRAHKFTSFRQSELSRTAKDINLESLTHNCDSSEKRATRYV